MENISLVQVIVSGGLIAIFIENLVNLIKRYKRIKKIKELVIADFKKYLGIAGLIRNVAKLCIDSPFQLYSAKGFDLIITNCIFSEGLITEFEIERIIAIREIKIALDNVQVFQDEVIKYPQLTPLSGMAEILGHQNRLIQVFNSCIEAESLILSYLKESWKKIKPPIPPIPMSGIIRLP